MNDADRHVATHLIDDRCCDVLRHCTAMIDAACGLGLHGELAAVANAAKALHAKASQAHAECLPTVCPPRARVSH